MNEKEFEKQQLEQLLNDLKDIDKYTSFKNGAFIYDLGKYQGSLLINHINNLQSKIDEAIEWIEQYEKQIGTLGETSKSIVLTDDVIIGNLLDILKEDK
jgi:hypothetical protein